VLTKKGKYALKAMAHLQQFPPGHLVHVVDIAEQQNIPKRFLNAILFELQRKAARKVVVFQWPYGALAMSARPRSLQPWVCVILVFAQVSSMKTRRFGSSFAWIFFQRARWRATSGRSCSAGHDPLPNKKPARSLI